MATRSSIWYRLPARIKGWMGYARAVTFASGRSRFHVAAIPMLAPALPDPRRALPPVRRGTLLDCE